MQLEWHYLQRNVPGVGTLMGLIEEALREKLFPALFGEEDITANFWQILGHSIKHGGLVIPDHRLSAESAYNTSKVTSRELVDSLLRHYALNYVGHRAYVRTASQTARQTKKSVQLAKVFKRQELAEGQERDRFHRATRNGAWLSSVPHCLNGTELSWEEFRDNLRLRYG